jgi:hypothetical protein
MHLPQSGIAYFLIRCTFMPVRKADPARFLLTSNYLYYFIYIKFTHMPLVIKELHIKITVNKPLQAQQPPAASAADAGITMAGDEKGAIVSPGTGNEREGEKKDY